MVFGIVYSITCVETGEIYVGSTAGSINQRMAGHECNCNRYDRGEKISNCSAFNIIRRGNYKVRVLEHIEFNHKYELHQRERHFIAELGAINVMRRPNVTKDEIKQKNKELSQNESAKKSKSERDKAYREKHREELLAKKREYHQNNKEAIAEKSKAYREANAEAIKEKKKAEYLKAKENGLCEIITCECGGTFTHRSKARHLKTKKHQDFLNN